MFKTIDRGATTSLISMKPNTIIPYFDKTKESLQIDEADTGSLSFTDNFNKKLIANLNPKTIKEELNIRKNSG